VSKVFELDEYSVAKNLMPIIALIDVPFTEHVRDLSSYSRSPSPFSTRHDSGVSPELNDELIYGLPLLQHIASEIQKQNLSKLVVPVAIASYHDRRWFSSNTSKSAFSTSEEISLASDVTRVNTPGANSSDQGRLSRYLDAGAADLLTSPISKDRVTALGVLAYRAHKEATKEQSAFLSMKRGRKRSWVGVDDEKPYAYLREQMFVASLAPPRPLRLSGTSDYHFACPAC
jgi:3',5'-cyclic-nucleotide phosphodiesterase